ncbi:MAG TPA: hypothetical protein VGB82_04115 [Alphaproteobacteria bacterium]
MRGLQLYARYRSAIRNLAESPTSREHWQKEIQTLVRQAATDLATLEPQSAQQLRDELCGQLEQEALRATTPHRSAVLLAAVNGLESISVPVANR